jgi:DNA-binding CsgD family transcriptional regulator
VRSLAVSYFFVMAAMAAVAIWMAHAVQVRHRQPYLPAFTLYVVAWSALTLLSIVQFVLGELFLPRGSVDAAIAAGGPLFATLLAISMYFLARFMADLAGRGLSRGYSIGYAILCAAVALIVVLASRQASDAEAGWRMAASISLFFLKMLTVYGWSAFAWWRCGTFEDRLERAGRRGVVLAFLAGFLIFEGALREVAAVFGLRTSNYAISFCQLLSLYPPLVYLGVFLRRRSLARPPEPPSAPQRVALAESGLSAREAEVVELILTGLSHKEVAGRLGISPETVKKHTYNAYRRLGVQNRVQLSYWLQNRADAVHDRAAR